MERIVDEYFVNKNDGEMSLVFWRSEISSTIFRSKAIRKFDHGEF